MLTPHVGRPDEPAIRLAIAASLPHLADRPLAPLGDGWAFSAFLVGDTVLRFPRSPEFVATLTVEATVMREMAPTLPLPVSVIEVHEGGPSGLPFTSHRLVPGVPVATLQRPLAAGAGAALGRFLRAMHAFPVDRAVALGLANPTPEQRREARRRFYREQVVARIFPLVSQEARSHMTMTFEAFLAEDSNFHWQPVVSHSDIDGRNLLADPGTGELSGVIDWGDISIHDPAGDFTDALYGSLGRAGLLDQLPALTSAYGMTMDDLDAMRPRCRFYEYCWPLHEIIYGLDTANDDFVRSGIAFLHEAILAAGQA